MNDGIGCKQTFEQGYTIRMNYSQRLKWISKTMNRLWSQEMDEHKKEWNKNN